MQRNPEYPAHRILSFCLSNVYIFPIQNKRFKFFIVNIDNDTGKIVVIFSLILACFWGNICIRLGFACLSLLFLLFLSFFFFGFLRKSVPIQMDFENGLLFPPKWIWCLWYLFQTNLLSVQYNSFRFSNSLSFHILVQCFLVFLFDSIDSFSESLIILWSL